MFPEISAESAEIGFGHGKVPFRYAVECQHGPPSLIRRFLDQADHFGEGAALHGEGVEVVQIGGQGVIGEVPLAASGHMVAGDDGHVTLPVRPFAHVGVVAGIAEGEVRLSRDSLGYPPPAFADLPLHVVERHRLQAVGAGLLEGAGAGMVHGVVAHLVAGFRHGFPGRQKTAPVGSPRVDVERAEQAVSGQHRHGPVQLGPHAVVEGKRHGAFAAAAPGMGPVGGHEPSLSFILIVGRPLRIIYHNRCPAPCQFPIHRLPDTHTTESTAR